jgi:very-short-patch-repair endonuclease
MRKAYPNLIGYARALRGSMTLAETVLWKELRTRRHGKFRRQHPIAGYILDFYCATARLCIEVDGGIHDTPRQALRDADRTRNLTEMGIRTLRFRNEEVMHDLPTVLSRIHQSLTLPPYPLPPGGEGGARQRAG